MVHFMVEVLRPTQDTRERAHELVTERTYLGDAFAPFNLLTHTIGHESVNLFVSFALSSTQTGASSRPNHLT